MDTGRLSYKFMKIEKLAQSAAFIPSSNSSERVAILQILSRNFAILAGSMLHQIPGSFRHLRALSTPSVQQRC